MRLVKRFFKEPGRSFFFFGPRGTGKTTLIKSLHNKSIYIDLLQHDTFRSYLARPEHLKNVVNAQENNTVIIIDEIQRVPALLTIVHSLIEEKRGLKYIQKSLKMLVFLICCAS